MSLFEDRQATLKYTCEEDYNENSQLKEDAAPLVSGCLQRFYGTTDEMTESCLRIMTDVLTQWGLSKKKWPLQIAQSFRGKALGWFHSYSRSKSGEDLTDWPLFKNSFLQAFSSMLTIDEVTRCISEIRFNNVVSLVETLKWLHLRSPPDDIKDDQWASYLLYSLPKDLYGELVKIRKVSSQATGKWLTFEESCKELLEQVNLMAQCHTVKNKRFRMTRNWHHFWNVALHDVPKATGLSVRCPICGRSGHFSRHCKDM